MRIVLTCPVCGTRPVSHVCEAGTDAGTARGEMRCGPCTMASGAAWDPIPDAMRAALARAAARTIARPDPHADPREN